MPVFFKKQNNNNNKTTKKTNKQTKPSLQKKKDKAECKHSAKIQPPHTIPTFPGVKNDFISGGR